MCVNTKEAKFCQTMRSLELQRLKKKKKLVKEMERIIHSVNLFIYFFSVISTENGKVTEGKY